MAAPATPLAPLPPPNSPLTSPNGQGQSQAAANYLQALDQTVRSGNFPTLSVNGSAALTIAGGQTLTGGFAETEVAITVTAGAWTPDPTISLKQGYTNNAALTVNAPTRIGDVELHITNGATAGAISFSSFTKQWSGDTLDTTNGHQFVVFIYGFSGASGYLIKALQ